MIFKRTELSQTSFFSRALLFFLASLLWAACLLFCATVVLIVVDLRQAETARRPWAGPVYERVGADFVCRHPRMAAHAFSARKPEGRFRVFVVGDSTALGWPYVKRQSVLLPGLSLPSDKAGTACWLEAGLKDAGLDAEAVNAGMEWGTAEEEAAVVAEIVKVGSPDAIVVLTGHSEGNRMFDEGICPPGTDLDAALYEITRGFEAGLDRITEVCAEAGLKLVFLTAPLNLRDWRPEDAVSLPGLTRAAELVEAGQVGRAQEILDAMDAEDCPLCLNLLGRIRAVAGDMAGAQRLFLRANDKSRRFVSTRTPWNAALLAHNGAAPGVFAFDMAQAFYDRSPDGVPGFDFFLDNCHMNLRGQRLAARLTAAFVLDRVLERPGLAARLGSDAGAEPEPERVRTALRTARFNLLRYRLVRFVLGLRTKTEILPSDANAGRLYENYTNRIREYSRALDRGLGRD